jgi:hypothetical protein
MAEGNLDVGQQMEQENESSLVAAAKRHPYASAALGAAMATPLALPAVGAAAIGYGVDQFYQGKGEEGRVAARDGQQQVNDRNAQVSDGDDYSAYANGATKKQVVDYTRPHWSPDKAQQGQSVEQKVLSPEGQEAVIEERDRGVMGAAYGSQAKHKEQTAIYDIARAVEDDRRGYAEQEKAAVQKFQNDMAGAQLRVQSARERLAQFGDAPKATVVAAFEKADGPRKAAGLIGMIMGGVGAAGFSAITHQPQKNAFFESFEREASKVVDKWMTDRDTAGKTLSAEQQGMDAIRQAFGDDRAAREFVMGAVMKTYAAKLEQVAAQYGIDRTRADYQALLAQVAGRYADRQMAVAANVSETQQQSQKYMQAQPIYAEVPVGDAAAAQADPDFQRDQKVWDEAGRQLEAETKRYGAFEQMPPELQEQVRRHAAEGVMLGNRVARLVSARSRAGKQALMGPLNEEQQKTLDSYAEAREKNGITTKERLRQATDRLVRKMRAKGGQSLKQQIAMFVAGGATNRGEALVSRFLADDPQLAQDWAYIANTYRLEQAGKSVTKNEIGTIVGALGTGDMNSVANVAGNLARDVDLGERSLIAQFGEEPYLFYHARQKLLAKSKIRMPHNDLQVPE